MIHVVYHNKKTLSGGGR